MHASEAKDDNVASRGRVGYVVKMYPRFSETFILTEILSHERAGLEVDVFSLRHANEGRFHEGLARVRAPVHYLDSAGLKASDLWEALRAGDGVLPNLWEALAEAAGENHLDVHQAVQIATIARQRGITHLHAHFASVATSVALLAARMARITYSFTAHAKDIFHDSVDAADMRAKLRDAAGIVTVSDFNVEHLRREYSDAAGGVRRVYNGLDLEEFSFRPAQAREAIVLAIGRLVEKKGFDDFLAACDLMARRGVRFEAQIIGTGELEPSLRVDIARRGLGERVRMLGPRPRSEVIERLRSARVLAVPCVIGADGNRDGLPTVLLEAMALGTPVISTDVTGIPEVVREGHTGWLVPQHAPEALARAIEHALHSGSEGERLATNARRLMEAEFDIHRNTSAIRAIFHQNGARPAAATGATKAAAMRGVPTP